MWIGKKIGKYYLVTSIFINQISSERGFLYPQYFKKIENDKNEKWQNDLKNWKKLKKNHEMAQKAACFSGSPSAL